MASELSALIEAELRANGLEIEVEEEEDALAVDPNERSTLLPAPNMDLEAQDGHVTLMGALRWVGGSPECLQRVSIPCCEPIFAHGPIDMVVGDVPLKHWRLSLASNNILSRLISDASIMDNM